MPTDKLSTGQPAAAGRQWEAQAVSPLGLYEYGGALLRHPHRPLPLAGPPLGSAEPLPFKGSRVY